MGHSEVSPLQNVLVTEDAIVAPLSEVRVWGDMSHFELRDAASGSGPGPTDRGTLAPIGDERRPPGESHAPEDFYHRIGQLTRTLHDAMRELGYHEHLADARDNLPDARDRLAYIERLTGDAAEKVLNSVDRARSLQDEISQRAQALRTRWAAVAAYTAGGGRATPAGAALVEETCEFLATLGSQAELTNAILTEIMMAQDFHDLTGQVIRKVVHLAQTLEEQLVKLLIDANQGEVRRKVEAEGLEGPLVNGEDRSDVVADQAGVDALLASLGF